MKKVFPVVVCLLLGLVATRGGPPDLPDAVAQARKAYLVHEFDEALSLCEGQSALEAKLVSCLSFYEKYELYKDSNDKKRGGVLLDILKIDMTLSDVEMLKQYFNLSGHPKGNQKAAELLKTLLKQSGTAGDALVIVNLLAGNIGDEAAYPAYCSLERHVKNVRQYVNRGGTMPDAERELFQNEELHRVLAKGLQHKKTDRPAMYALVAIEEPALDYLEKSRFNLPVGKLILKIKKARAKRLEKYPESTWDSAFGRRTMPAPSVVF